MVSKASEDLPDPERPVNTISFSRGSSTVRFLRLCSRAPLMCIESVDNAPPGRLSYGSVIRIRGEHLFVVPVSPGRTVNEEAVGSLAPTAEDRHALEAGWGWGRQATRPLVIVASPTHPPSGLQSSHSDFQTLSELLSFPGRSPSPAPDAAGPTKTTNANEVMIGATARVMSK